MAAVVNKEHARFFIKYWLPVIIYAILIFLVSAMPGTRIPLIFRFQDIAFHMLEYAGFSFFIARALKARNPKAAYGRRFFLMLLIVVLYAVTDELHQAVVPQRISSPLDVFYDAAGAALLNLFYR